MIRNAILSLICTLSVLSAHALVDLNNQLPIEAEKEIGTFIINHCAYLGSEAKLESYRIDAISVNTVIGYVDAIKEAKVEVQLYYGNEDYTYQESTQLSLNNLTGQYRITSASGPCETLIQANE